jgi:hypothetical protein
MFYLRVGKGIDDSNKNVQGYLGQGQFIMASIISQLNLHLTFIKLGQTKTVCVSFLVFLSIPLSEQDPGDRYFLQGIYDIYMYVLMDIYTFNYI